MKNQRIKIPKKEAILRQSGNCVKSHQPDIRKITPDFKTHWRHS